MKSPAIWIPAALVVLISGLYYQVGGFDFVNYDDKAYFYDNPNVTEGLSTENVRWAFEIHGPSMWIPLTWLSHQAAVSAFGIEPSPHHWINVVLHALNAALLFWVITRYTGYVWRAGLIAALFALHPIHVESVAWITERKDVLSMAFVLGTLLAYHSYAKSANFVRFALVCGLHTCAVSAKPLAVTLPCILLLLDFWPLKRTVDLKSCARCALEKLPLLLISAFASWMTILCQLSIQAIGSLEGFPLNTRILNALVNYATYLRKIVAPIDLVPFYPYEYARPLGEVLLAALLLISISVLALSRARKRDHAPLIGWLWFLGAFVPMIGIVQAGSHAMADRYAYLPFIGIYIAIVWVAAQLLEKFKAPRPLRFGCAILPLTCYTILSFQQIQIWQDSEQLFEHTIAKSPGNYLAHNNLGLALKASEQIVQANWHFKKSIQINPYYTEALNNAGISAAEKGNFVEAGHFLIRGIQSDATNPTSRHNLAKVRFSEGAYPEAEQLFQAAIRLRPDFVEAHYDFGCLLLAQGRPLEAIKSFQKAVEISPKHVDAHINLGVAFYSLHRRVEAREAYQRALAIDPESELARANLNQLDSRPEPTTSELSTLAVQMREQGLLNESLRLYLRALEQAPTNADLQNDVGVAFGLLKDHELALIHFNEAIRLAPDHRLARQNRAAAEAALMEGIK